MHVRVYKPAACVSMCVCKETTHCVHTGCEAAVGTGSSSSSSFFFFCVSYKDNVHVWLPHVSSCDDSSLHGGAHVLLLLLLLSLKKRQLQAACGQLQLFVSLQTRHANMTMQHAMNWNTAGGCRPQYAHTSLTERHDMHRKYEFLIIL